MRPGIIRKTKVRTGVEINIYLSRSKGLENWESIFKGKQSAVPS